MFLKYTFTATKARGEYFILRGYIYLTGDIVSPDVVVVDPNSRVESGDEHGATAKPLPHDLGPFSRIHEDYKLHIFITVL